MPRPFLMNICHFLAIVLNLTCSSTLHQSNRTSKAIPKQTPADSIESQNSSVPTPPLPAGAATDSLCNASKLYGESGQQWRAAGNLPDFGWAGYHTGLDPIPEVAGPVFDITRFGAIADDAIDDSDAIQSAIDAARPGIVLIPKGRFIILKKLSIDHGNMVIRGQGPEQTILYLPKSLGEVYGLTKGPPTNWSFSGGFISAEGHDRGSELTKLTNFAKRGDQTIQVASSSKIKVGQWVRIVMKDSGGTLLKSLHLGQYPGAMEDVGRKTMSFYSPVTSLTEKTITLARNLPFDIDPLWMTSIKAVDPTISELGLEHFSMQFVGTPYPGHFKEQGYNAIDLSGVQNSWVRDIKILNADYGINIRSSFFVSVSDIILDADGSRGKLVGHHGLNSSAGADIFFTRFDIRQTFFHDLTVDDYALMTVWSKGRGLDLAMDHHGRASYGTLWTDIDVGLGTRPFFSGGSSVRMPHSGAFTTFWNLRAQKPVLPVPANFGPALNFVAMIDPFPAQPKDWSIEKWANAELCQSDLHEAMLAKRKIPLTTSP
ncbi:MAG TPA: glycosyl hydrolase family 28-related protein [Oligoflexus sp.]|uniref:glycosyl hydrolase family 28-related protein n=1 Tax=Oligoflexus sp. TaxID=1971216 RepID=UPI002D65BCBF|nr:glycosyl hydrolase family 28-related protein [Oligoflexus sp.]HYX34137.1 glycosyl hydrolase family 28-related protein [Oligoflexus sp.]